MARSQRLGEAHQGDLGASQLREAGRVEGGGPGGTIVDYTAGTTGISLAMVCAALGYKAHFVFSDAFSDEKRFTMRAYGAEITDVPSDHGKITEALIKAMIATAGEISHRQGHWWSDQLNNRDGETAGGRDLGTDGWAR